MNSVLSVLVLCFGFVKTETWDHYLKLNPDYDVWWSIEGDWITFQVEVATRGWVGFGISPNGGMEGSDVVIGWVNNEKAWFHDRYAEGRFQPKIDDHQDWEFLWCCENETHTSIRFKRLLVTCDDQDLPITNDTMKFIYAYHSDDPTSPDTVMYHGAERRGTKSVLVNKLDTSPTFYDNPEDLKYWDVTSPKIPLPEDKDTMYYCTLKKRPNLQRKHHIIEVSPLIQPGNERFVHHMLLYECVISEEEISTLLNEPYHICYDENGEPKFVSCLTATFGWAIGGGPMHFPEKVGLPIGLSDVVYYLLEVHYDNPGLEKGIIDSSGMRITYTSKLRQYDSSMLTIGSLWFPCVFIPPKQKEFVVTGHGHPSCLRESIPPEGIKVFSSMLHSHILGKKILVRQFRGNEELPPLIEDKHYDFNYQDYHIFPEERTILPDDHLIVECTYDSSKRTETTFGGFSTSEEMCLAFLAYYPRVSISHAVSCPAEAKLLKSMGVQEISADGKFVKSPLTGRNESYYEYIRSYSWDENSVNNVQKAMMYSPHINLCSDQGKDIPNSGFSRYPRIRYLYQESDVCATRSQQEEPTAENPPGIIPGNPIVTDSPQESYPPGIVTPSRKPQRRFPPKVRTTRIPQNVYPPTIEPPATRKPTKRFPPIVRTRRPENVYPPTIEPPATRKPTKRFPPVVRTRRPQSVYPPTINPVTRKPTRGFPPKMTMESTTENPTTKNVPHVLPYPLIEQMIVESG